MKNFITDKKIKAGAALLGALVLVGVITMLHPNSSVENVASAWDNTCADGATLTAVEAKAQADEGRITVDVSFNEATHQTTAKVTNNTLCAFPGSFADYKMFDQKLSTQVYFHGTATRTVAAGATETFTIDFPACMTQADFYYGDVWHKLYDDNRNGSFTLGFGYFQNNGTFFGDATGNFCTNAQPVAVSCTADSQSINIGDNVTYKATATGGNGTYAYSWTGTEGLTGTTAGVTKNYSTSGAKNATVTVTSNGTTATATCGTTVAVPQVPTLIGSCQASAASVRVGDPVTWGAAASGGTGTYTYSWGDASSFFESAHQTTTSYGTPGTKTETVLIKSGDQTVTKSCNVNVYQDTVVTNNLTGYCSLDTSNLKVGDTAVWRAHASGGNGAYSYSWSGDDNLNGSGDSVYRIYSSAGLKNANLRITDASGQTVTSNCTTNIANQTTSNNNLQISCQANPSTANVGQAVTWTANATGGNGGYSYSWSGDYGLTGTNQSQSGTYATPGTKNASVRVTSSDGESQVTNCNMQVNQGTVTVYTNTDNTPTSQVYLSQVPYTGPMDNLKMALYVLAFLGWSGAISYAILRKKYGPNAMAMVTAQAGAMKDEFSEKLNSLRSLRTVKKSPEIAKAEQALEARSEMLKKLWDRSY